MGINPIRTRRFKVTLSSDASRTGWGAESSGKITHGFWNQSNQRHHINYLELLAALFALKCFASHEHSCEILIRIDNTTAIACVNKGGSIKYPILNELARKIWQWCEVRKLWLFASYIPSKENIHADSASRVKNIDTEWEFSETAYKKIVTFFGSLSIDLFASRINSKCKRFCSRFQDPYAESMVPIHIFTLPATYNFQSISIITLFSLQGKETSTGTTTLVSGRQLIRQAFLYKGASNESLDILLDSLSTATLKQYDSSLKASLSFSDENRINLFEPSTSDIINFLTKKFNEGVKYGTLNSCRSAISLIFFK